MHIYPKGGSHPDELMRMIRQLMYRAVEAANELSSMPATAGAVGSELDSTGEVLRSCC